MNALFSASSCLKRDESSLPTGKSWVYTVKAKKVKKETSFRPEASWSPMLTHQPLMYNIGCLAKFH